MVYPAPAIPLKKNLIDLWRQVQQLELKLKYVKLL